MEDPKGSIPDIIWKTQSDFSPMPEKQAIQTNVKAAVQQTTKWKWNSSLIEIPMP